ncbi:5-oxoprolinase subunit B family protein [Tropicibacter naphthalenivorans]|uniref:Sporulation inhibitor KipI n=1 Tax=Tropicibacter naphthalenivorans TaxID=441103 RepID=A0A0N7LYU3_9RHOB|nr:allophanate hydrolase subunit 1 [Tropicibacter naphthalenivorans]CUH75825.1 Sporulation inhibitor KipI [Tropicibacter naphthalenivorans]SMC42033.1 sensor histidine kinase inhibitor, KipI family [Tropicibacter naphthalenivorans]
MSSQPFPSLASVGLDGLLVRFADHLSEPANRAALAFRAALERANIPQIEETSTSLVSTYVRFDPLHLPLERLEAQIKALLAGQDWYAAELPSGRRLIEIPTVYGTDLAPQLAEAARLAGMSEAEAITSLSSARTRVTTIGFAPGQPYLGTLPEPWDIPRQTGLTPKVPVGALVVAIRQFVLFSVSTPTGWRHIGQTAAQLFQPDAAEPFLLRPGDEVVFPAVPRDAFEALQADPMGGIRMRPL